MSEPTFSISDETIPNEVEVAVNIPNGGTFYVRVHRCGAPSPHWQAVLAKLGLAEPPVEPVPAEPGETVDRSNPATYDAAEAANLLASLIGVADDEGAIGAIARWCREQMPTEAPAPVSDPLPEGVERISDGWVCRGSVLPSLAGVWERRSPRSPDEYVWEPITEHSGTGGPHRLYEVRPTPPPEPRTEQVPLHKLIGRYVIPDAPVTSFTVGEGTEGEPVRVFSAKGNFLVPLDADGCVTVTYSDETDA